MKTIDQKIATAEAQVKRLREKKRTALSREKYVLAGLVLANLKTDPQLKEKVLALLDGVERDSDKASAKSLSDTLRNE